MSKTNDGLDVKPAAAQVRTRGAQVTPHRGPRRFALPKGRVAQLVARRLHVFAQDLSHEETVEAPDAILALGTLADGALLVVGARQSGVLAPGEKTCQSATKLTLSSDSIWAWGDPSAPRRFFVSEGSFVGANELTAGSGKVTALGDDFRIPDEITPLPGGGAAAINPGMLTLHAPGSERQIELPPNLQPTQLAPLGQDAGWMAAGSKLLHVSFAGSALKVLAQSALPGTITSIDANAAHLAALVVEGAAGKPQSLQLVLLDAKGKRLWQAATPFQPATAQKGQLAVLLGRFDKIVAVGSEKELAVWDVTSGKLLGARP